MSKQISKLLIVLSTIFLMIVVISYILNKFILRENFESKTKDMVGSYRRMTRNYRKYKEHFIGHVLYKIKSGLRKAKL
jgi:hypothetical protein